MRELFNDVREQSGLCRARLGDLRDLLGAMTLPPHSKICISTLNHGGEGMALLDVAARWIDGPCEVDDCGRAADHIEHDFRFCEAHGFGDFPDEVAASGD